MTGQTAAPLLAGRRSVHRELFGRRSHMRPADRRARGLGATTHLDGAIVARGQLAVSGNVKQIQHRDGGIVERILVRDGMRVEAGSGNAAPQTTARCAAATRSSRHNSST